MKRLDKQNTIRLIAVIIFLIVSVAATILMIPFIKDLATESGRMVIKEHVEKFGAWGWLMFLLLQILQVVVALIPGEPVEIVGGVLFGTFAGMFLCLIGLLIGTIIIFYLIKTVGTPLVYAFVPKEKFNHFKILNDEKKLETLIFILFIIPGTPKDTLTYIVPLTKINPLKFFILSTIARIPSVFGSTLVGENIGKGNWIWTIIIFLITAAIGLVGIFYNDKLVKEIKSKHIKNH